LQFFTVVGAVGAGLVAAFVPAGPLYFAFAVLLLLTAHRMWPWRQAPAHSASGFTGRRRGAAQGASVGSGVVSGLLGVGGGVLNVPILHLLVGMPFERAVATSVYIIGLTAAAGAAVYVARGDVRLWIAGATLLGTLLGAGIAALVARRFDAGFLKGGFVVLLLYVAVRMVSRGVAQF
ncbi:MAG: sulfite exporter TauE/SafE family protein, partial [Gemmatimonadota bacterium]|nr:sulfite exporter TauE/SafE family protein [Gemmatimonadota bacterium]